MLNPYLYGLLYKNYYKYTTDHKVLKYLSSHLQNYNSYLYYNSHSGIYEICGNLSNMNFNTANHELPKHFLINSLKNRLLLLIGLLQINNYFKNGYYNINISEPELEYANNMYSNGICRAQNVSDFEFLIKSLGFSIRKTYVNNNIYLYIINNDVILTQLDHFLEIPQGKYILNDINIECIGIQKYYGFEVDNNSLFMLDNCIVTHNSWLVRDIFYHHQHIPSGVVFSGTEEANPFFGEFIPDCFIHSEYNPDLIDKIMEKQKKKIRDAKKTGVKDGKCPANNLFIVFDDMLHDAQNWKNEKTIKNIFFNGRHYNFLFILTMQYPLGITPALRSNIDYVFIFNEPSLKNRRKIYDDYGAIIPSFEHFCNILDACTQNHECLVIKTSGNSSDLKDNVFWYKAESHVKFKVGHEKFWNFHNQHYNKNYEDDNMEDNEKITQLKEKFSNTKKLKVIVSRQNDHIVNLDYSN